MKKHVKTQDRYYYFQVYEEDDLLEVVVYLCMGR